MLDAEENFHLALHASTAGDPHACLTYLQEVLRGDPGNAHALYLRASVHAELGLVRRAIVGIEDALAIDASLETARFQLALLLLETGRCADARAHLVLVASSRNDMLRIYSDALVAMADGDNALAAQKLEFALTKGSQNSALTTLMRRVLDHVTKDDRSVPAATVVQLRAYSRPEL